MPDSFNITDFFTTILREAGTIDVANSEFKRALAENDDLRDQYRRYCHETGNTERRAFLDFCEEYLSAQDEVWDSLNEFEE